MCHNGTKLRNRRDDATDECLRLAVRYMAEKEGQLVQQGRDGYANEIRATFRPSAAILLKAWEDLLADIEDTDIDENNCQDYEN